MSKQVFLSKDYLLHHIVVKEFPLKKCFLSSIQPFWEVDVIDTSNNLPLKGKKQQSIFNPLVVPTTTVDI